MRKAKSLFFNTGAFKLVLFSWATLQFYEIYWFYKQWKAVKEQGKAHIHIPLRVVFGIYYTFPLFSSIYRAGSRKRRKSFLSRLKPYCLGLAYLLGPSLLVAIIIISGLGLGLAAGWGEALFTYVYFISPFFLIPVQSAAHAANRIVKKVGYEINWQPSGIQLAAASISLVIQSIVILNIGLSA